MKQSCKKAAVCGIAGVLLYFLAVTLFLVTKSDIALTLWEIMTVAGAVIMLAVLEIVAEEYGIGTIYGRFLSVSLSGTLIITSIAHFTSIGVIDRLRRREKRYRNILR